MPVYLPPISRRRFLKGSFAAATALALGQGCASPKRPREPEGFALFSDIHIAADPHRVERGANMTKNLRASVREVMGWRQRPTALFIDGDLAFNNGESADYAAVVELLRPLREEGMPIYLELGNHDNRERFWAGMRHSKRVEPGMQDRQAAIIRSREANWFLLDSLIQTRVTPGMLGAEQLAWLARALDANPNRPALIMIHHQPEFGHPQKHSGLEDTAELLAILRPRAQVKAYFFGHTHHWQLSQDESGIHLINFPPTSYLFKEGLPNGWVHATAHPDSMSLELRCLDQSRSDQGQVAKLAWRTA